MMAFKPIIIQATVDGSCSGNPGPGAVGYVLQCGDYKREFALSLIGEQTNSRTELYAIRQALLQIDATKRKRCQVNVTSDSQYAVNVISGKKIAHKNLDLVDEIRVLIELFGSVNFSWVPRDSTPELRKADELAKSAIKNGAPIVL